MLILQIHDHSFKLFKRLYMIFYRKRFDNQVHPNLIVELTYASAYFVTMFLDLKTIRNVLQKSSFIYFNSTQFFLKVSLVTYKLLVAKRAQIQQPRKYIIG